MTFVVFDLGSKYPYFNRAYVIGVCILFVTAVNRVSLTQHMETLEKLLFQKNDF